MLDIIRNYLNSLVSQEEGQDLAEYALLLALIAIVVALALPGVATAITTTFNNIAAAL